MDQQCPSCAARGRSPSSIVVGVPTFRRPDALRALVPRLLDECEDVGSARVVVVDNDPHGSAREAVIDWVDAGVTYLHEPTPGVAAARNRILDDAADADVVVFIDDDQIPGAQWLRRLISAWKRTEATAVAGPVSWAFDGEMSRWVEVSGRFQRRSFPSGSVRAGAGTGNLLVDLAFVRRAGLRFDDAFGLTGGEDTLFTRSLVREGGVIRWADDAEVVETVPRDRLSRRWVLSRDRRSGNAWTRVHIAMEPSRIRRLRVRAELTLRGLWRCARGIGRAAAGRALRRLELRVAGERDVAAGVGVLEGVVGVVIEEYRRDP